MKCLLMLHARSVVSGVRLFAISCTGVRQASPLCIGFPRQEQWSGLPFLPPGDLPNPGVGPMSPACPDVAGEFFPAEDLGSCLPLETR